jgi:hypothetical protein
VHFAIALAEEAGERIVPVQHGGSYGIVRNHPDVGELEYPRYAFLTWGWTEREGPLPSCTLARAEPHSKRSPRPRRAANLRWRALNLASVANRPPTAAGAVAGLPAREAGLSCGPCRRAPRCMRL